MSWSEQRRLDKAAERAQDREDRRLTIEGRLEAERLRAEERRKDDEAAAKLKRQRDTDKTKAKTQRKQQQADARKRAVAAVTAHMPIAGIPVVLASMLMAWGGQYQAAGAVGFGAYAVGVPVMLEGLTLTLAALTSAAMTARKPHASLMLWTWLAAFLAAGVNAYGHMLEGGHGAVLKAAVFAIASLLGVFLWWKVATAHNVRRTKAERSEDRARKRHARVRRFKHRVVAKVARDLVAAHEYGGLTLEQAWPQAWRIVHGTDQLGHTPKLRSRSVRSSAAYESATTVDDATIRARILAHFGHGEQPGADADGEPRWVLPTPALATNVTPIRDLVRPIPNGPQKGARSRGSSQVNPQVPTGKKRGAPGGPPVRGIRRKGDTPKYSTAARKAASITAKEAPLTKVNGSR
jgi:hypothetical protein